MGNRPSQSAEQKAAWEREKALKKHGVLIPPSFAIEGATSAARTLLQQPLQPSLIEELVQSSISHRILNEYLQPGFFLSSAVDGSTDVRAAFTLPATSSTASAGRIVAQRSTTYSTSRVSMGTEDGPPTLSLGYQMTPGWLLYAHLGAGHGWLGTHLDVTLNQREPAYPSSPMNQADQPPDQSMRMRLGSWVPSSVKPKRIRTLAEAPSLIDAVLGYAAIDFLGSTAGVEVELPMSSLQPSTKSFFSMNLTGDEGPPLTIALSRVDQSPSSSLSAMSLSQVVHFDRFQLNPMEDRAPRIRNTLAWTLRMEQQVHDTESSTRLMLGGAWQINRGLALKAVIDQQGGVTSAVILKRWKHPRVSCSVLCRQANVRSSPGFLGIGLEIETGRLLAIDYAVDGPDMDLNVPETKAEVPTRLS